jgi:excisionase family DNA binding protein
MSQKFIGLDDAAEQLGVSKDRLNELREGGKLRAYRDGASWKFRSDDIAKLVEDGLPADSAASGISLDAEALEALE